jgi:hypothetical protein
MLYNFILGYWRKNKLNKLIRVLIIMELIEIEVRYFSINYLKNWKIINDDFGKLII